MGKQTISVIGAGTMGRGIAQVVAQAGYPVLLYDSEKGMAAASVLKIRHAIQKLLEKGELDEKKALAICENIAFADRLEAVAESAFIIEAIIEDRNEKRKLFKNLNDLCSRETIFASNTSSIPITDLASCTHHPETCIGMHFMNPVPLIPGVEIIRGAKTSNDTFEKTLRFAEQLAKKPVYSSDKAGFVINRILMPMINEAIKVVEEGTSTIEDVDNGAKFCLNHPIGPLALTDLIGLDTTHFILTVLEQEFGERLKPASLLIRLIDGGFYGNKNGAGFYRWEANKPQGVNPAVARFLNQE